MNSDDNIPTESKTWRLGDALRLMPDVGSDDDFAPPRDHLESPTTDQDDQSLASIAEWGAAEDWQDWAEPTD